MSTLSEIEAVVDALPAADKQELLLFLAARLREQAGDLPAPRRFSGEQLKAWIAEDEAEMQRFRDSNSGCDYSSTPAYCSPPAGQIAELRVTSSASRP